MERELFPMCAEEGLAVIPYNPLAGGLLTGKHNHAAPPPESADLAGYRVSAITGFGTAGLRPHTGGQSYNQVLHQRPDGQIENLRKIAGRA